MSSSPRIAFLDAATVSLNDDIDLSPIAECGEFTSYPATAPEEILARAAGREVLITNKVRLGEQHFAALPDLRLICEIATGTDNIDVAAAAARGIEVANVVGYGRFAVAQHTILLMTALAGRLMDYAADVRSGEWDRSPQFTLLRYPTMELNGRTLGLVGFGAIARSVAAAAAALGMRMLIHARSPRKDAELREYRARQVDLETLLAESDVVSVHLPLTEATRHLIDAPRLARMKPGAMLINTSRGAVVDEQALLDALVSGHLGGAALDVLHEEPPRDNPLTRLRGHNLIVTPHAAWSAREARQRLVEETAGNIRRWMNS